MKQVLIILLSIVYAAVTYQLKAQKVTVNIHSNEILIGDQVQLDITVQANNIDSLKWPLFQDTLSEHVEIVSELDPDTSSLDNSPTITRKLILTSFDSGLWAIPPIPVQIGEDVLETEPILLSVQTVEVDTSEAIKDIKDPLDTPYTFQEIMEIVGKTVGVIWVALKLIAILFYFIGKKPTVKVQEQKNTPSIAPHEWALQQLNELNESLLWQNGDFKTYHIKLSEVIRNYLEKRFDILALESTTHEIKSQLNRVDIPIELKEKIIEALTISDLTKFAKAQPLAYENEFAIKTAFRLVQETVPVVEDEPNNTEGDHA